MAEWMLGRRSKGTTLFCIFLLQLADHPNRGQGESGIGENVSRKAQRIEMVSTKQTDFQVNGKPLEKTLIISTQAVLGYVRSTSKVIGPFGQGDILAPPTIYVFHLFEKGNLKLTPLEHTMKGHTTVEISCFAGNKMKKLKKCVKQMNFNEEGQKKDNTDIYVVSSSFLQMTRFTWMLHQKYGAYRNGKLWADYVFKKPLSDSDGLMKSDVKHHAGGSDRITEGLQESFEIPSSEQQFHLASLASYKAFAGGLVEYEGHLCFSFTVSYYCPDWELFIDNKNMAGYFEIDRNADSVSLEWSLEKITVHQTFAKKIIRKPEFWRRKVTKVIFAQPPLSREFRLQTFRGGNATEKEVFITCNNMKTKIDKKKYNMKIKWKRLIAPIAVIGQMDFEPDFSRTWNQLKFMK